MLAVTTLLLTKMGTPQFLAELDKGATFVTIVSLCCDTPNLLSEVAEAILCLRLIEGLSWTC